MESGIFKMAEHEETLVMDPDLQIRGGGAVSKKRAPPLDPPLNAIAFRNIL